MKKPHKRKHTRLRNKSLYSQPGAIVHVIIGMHNKYPYFKDQELAYGFCDVLLDTSIEFGNRLYVYCIMPDHIHILVDSSEKMGIIEFVKRVKGRFCSWCREKGHNIKFQKSFYDHILRKDEDVMSIGRYIMENPVRAGIAGEVEEYPFVGSTEFSL